MAKRRDKTRGKAQTVEEAPPAPKQGGRGAWRVMDRGSAIVAGLLAHRVSSVAWRTVTGKKPPVSGRHPDVGTREAVAWAVVGGALVELVKVGVRRGTATYWVRSTGHLPPGMKSLTTTSVNDEEPIPAESAPERGARRKKLSRRSRGR